MSMTVISFKYMADAAAFLRTQAQVERSVVSIGQRFRESAVAGVAFAAGYKAFDAATNAIGNTAGAVVKYATDLQGARVALPGKLRRMDRRFERVDRPFHHEMAMAA